MRSPNRWRWETALARLHPPTCVRQEVGQEVVASLLIRLAGAIIAVLHLHEAGQAATGWLRESKTHTLRHAHEGLPFL